MRIIWRAPKSRVKSITQVSALLARRQTLAAPHVEPKESRRVCLEWAEVKKCRKMGNISRLSYEGIYERKGEALI